MECLHDATRPAHQSDSPHVNHQRGFERFDGYKNAAVDNGLAIHMLFRRATESLLDWLNGAKSGTKALDDVCDLRRAVEAMPLSSATYLPTINRVDAIEQYLRINERGALRWELNLLTRMLSRF